MDWGSRLKAAWHGDVPDADLRSMFAATESLTRLRQALEDRRLAVKLDAVGAEWRGVLALGRIAAPLWLGDALVGLAGTFYDDEKQAQPEPTQSVSAYTHDLVAALLAPVENIVADVAAALADPDHRTALSAPLHIGPSGQIAQGGLPEPISARYARSLATGVRRMHTAAAVTLAATQAEVVTAPAPDWLTAGQRRLAGELDAAGARLDMAEVRLASLLAVVAGVRGGGDPVALTAICRDLWALGDIAMVVGQVASDPHLLREAPPERGVAQAASVVASYQSLAPAHPPQRQAPAPLPRILEGAPSPREERTPASEAAQRFVAPTPSTVSLPSIGDVSGHGDLPSTTQPAISGEHGNIAFPNIGDPSGHQGANAVPPEKPRQGSQQQDGREEHGEGEAPSVRFPDIR